MAIKGAGRLDQRRGLTKRIDCNNEGFSLMATLTRDGIQQHIALESVERPRTSEAITMAWGSDAVAEVLRQLGIEFIALVPGSSYRCLHDSLVNYLGNERPQILLTLHEEHAVAVAHGYAKVTEQPMAVALHSNVGLMHASMAIFNAWCDRAPVLILGATGPVDATRRRPWIDWIHTARDQVLWSGPLPSGMISRPHPKRR